MTSTNTITKEQIDALLARSVWSDTKIGEKTTVVCCKLPNGFEVVESSGCVDPANYNHEMGVKICRERIVNQAWKLEGYRLSSDLAKPVMDVTPTIARICHEVNRAYCQALGDTSQVPWEDAPEWQRASAMMGVRLHLDNPNAGPQASHESWMRQKVADGWTYGPIKDAALKQHPCLVPFNDLPPAQQAKDFIFREVVHCVSGVTGLP